MRQDGMTPEEIQRAQDDMYYNKHKNFRKEKQEKITLTIGDSPSQTRQNKLSPTSSSNGKQNLLHLLLALSIAFQSSPKSFQQNGRQWVDTEEKIQRHMTDIDESKNAYRASARGIRESRRGKSAAA